MISSKPKISIKSKLKSIPKTLSKGKQNKTKLITGLTGALIGALTAVLILKRKRKSVIKKINVTYEILTNKIEKLEQKLKNEKVFHQVLIKNLDEKQKSQETQEFKTQPKIKEELQKLKKEKENLNEIIKKYDTTNKQYEIIRHQMQNDINKFVNNEKILINELKNKDKIISELQIK
jgi:gas vesicle protein